jgi:hypothetical protein
MFQTNSIWPKDKDKAGRDTKAGVDLKERTRQNSWPQRKERPHVVKLVQVPVRNSATHRKLH